MRRLVELRVQNFRSLREVAVTFAPLTVLAGPNGAGKSNLLDVVRFLGEAATGGLLPALGRRGGYGRVRFRGEAKGGIRIAVDALVTRSSNLRLPDQYELDVTRRRSAGDRDGDAGAIVREERFRFRRKGDQERHITVRGGEVSISQSPTGRAAANGAAVRLGLRRDALGLATLPSLSDAEGGEEVSKVAACFAGARVVEVDAGAARRPAGVVPDGEPLRADAANLAAFLSHLSLDDGRFAAYERDAQAVVPGLIAVEVEPADGSPVGPGVAVRLREMGLNGHTDLADASGGTVRALALLAALHDPAPPALTCVEEFDRGLHPEAATVLVERAREASSRTQLLLTSHSPHLLDALKPAELRTVERGEDGATRIERPGPAARRAVQP